MKRQEIRKSNYIAAFAIATLVFILGISLGNFFSQEKLNRIDKIEQDIKMDAMGAELQYMLFSENPCSTFDYISLNEELFKMGTRLESMESELGVDDPRVLELKEYYVLLEIRHWLFLKKVKEQCNRDYEFILYFYSNLGDCDNCKKQGYVFDYLHSKYQKINIYSFDFNINNPLITTLKSVYNITTTPSSVIYGETYNRYIELDEIENLLRLRNITK